MLKINPVFLILLCIIILGGCSKDTNSKENKFILEDVTKAIEAQKLELISYGITGYPPKLNDVIPEVYSVGMPLDKKENEPDFMHFYIFQSEKDRINGAEELNKQTENANSKSFPRLYQEGNVLIVYWSDIKENTRLDKPIEAALKQLNNA
ncbi:hypothetical protein BK120_17315 [Paenibacillus sp. FSL A5-0031]|uniref:hypothetical protein n=1 Tax=Paenibacillus sp. FSL A5-0031 TaxID=1920420 RepID=UPI00096BF485|nr:hypothetical protein [Paenibacillus sp. FSL A5-0031]OME81413.1 hypothetical protein BK120_17315 [Paenibacillus sp. FSL A5-0031]